MPLIKKGIKQYERIISTMDEGVVSITADGYIDIINEIAEKQINTNLKKIKGKQFDTLAFFSDNNIALADFPFQKCVMLSGEKAQESQIELNGKVIFNKAKEPIEYVLFLKDKAIESGNCAEASHIKVANKDQLTGSLNRQSFINELNLLLNNAVTQVQPHAFIYIDLDQFKAINDSCGHSHGDQILIEIAEMIRPCIRSSDFFGRLGGDEFGIMLVNCTSAPALRIAHKVAEIISEHGFEVDDATKKITTSIGLLNIDNSYQAVSDVIRDAEIACNLAKKKGINHIHQYVNTEQGVATYMDKIDWLDRIKSAINDDLFTLYFQSFANFSGETKLHGEVLLRLTDEDGKIVSPGEFMPCVEHFHLASKLDRYVVEKTLSFFEAHPQLIAETSMISINLSGESINDPIFRRYLYAKVAATRDVVNSIICFEITETIALANLEEVTPFINTLKSMGVSFALDDFGNGASSFTYLRQLPVDFLKIDGQLITSIDEEDFSQLTVECLTKIAKLSNTKTIAEWVETESVYRMVEKLGVDYVQGYYHHKPEPMSDFFSPLIEKESPLFAVNTQ